MQNHWTCSCSVSYTKLVCSDWIVWCHPLLYTTQFFICESIMTAKKVKQIKLQVHTFLSGVYYKEKLIGMWKMVKYPKNDDLMKLFFFLFLCLKLLMASALTPAFALFSFFPAAVGLRSWWRWRRHWGGHRGGGGPASCAHLLSAKEHAGHCGARPAETQTALSHLPEAGRQCAGGPAPLYRIQVSGLINICHMVNCKLQPGSSLSHWNFLPTF